MSQVINQFKKDFRLILLHPTFFLVAGILCSVWSFTFPRVLFQFADMSVSGAMPFGNLNLNIVKELFIGQHISLSHILFLLIVPVFTMKLLAEEKKLRTYDILLTSPISSWSIVFGKFLAAYVAVLILLAINFLYPLTVKFFTEYNMGMLVSAYLGMALLLMIYTSMGLFCSSLTSSIMLSVVLGVVFNIILHLISAYLTSQTRLIDNEFVREVLEYLSMNVHFEDFFQGNIVLSGVLFFFLVSGFLLFLCQRAIETSRWSA